MIKPNKSIIILLKELLKLSIILLCIIVSWFVLNAPKLIDSYSTLYPSITILLIIPIVVFAIVCLLCQKIFKLTFSRKDFIKTLIYFTLLYSFSTVQMVDYFNRENSSSVFESGFPGDDYYDPEEFLDKKCIDECHRYREDNCANLCSTCKDDYICDNRGCFCPFKE